MNLAYLAKRQAAIAKNILNHVADPSTALSPLYQEDITRGWRWDVLRDDVPGLHPQSLHWQVGSYRFGADQDIEYSSPRPIEGFVSPSATTGPAPGGSDASDSPDPAFLVHEAIARWDGWGLAAPTPFSVIGSDGTIAESGGNPVTTYSDDGHMNGQISATFTVPPANQRVVGNDRLLGYTGLPPLRFGRTYGYKVRSVDLSGWSISQLDPIPAEYHGSLSVPHQRWEPIRPPQVVPTSSLTVGEGVLTVVLRDDGTTPPTGNSRWLFPPQVHAWLAEQQGALDTADGMPDPTRYATLSAYADGSIATLPGIGSDTGPTGNAGNAILPLPTGGDPPATSVTWLPDFAAYGLAIDGLGQQFPVTPTVPPAGVPTTGGTSPTSVTTSRFLDAWSPAPGGRWPAMLGKLLTVVPEAFSPVEPGSASYLGVRALAPTWSTRPATPTTAEILIMGVTPGSVVELALSSIPHYTDEKAFGLVPWKPGDAADAPTDLAFVTGALAQITPATTLRVVYATLRPAFAPSFSAEFTQSRTSNDTVVELSDPRYGVDPATTSAVTFTASWTDHSDTATNAHPDTDLTVHTQGSLVAEVTQSYLDVVGQTRYFPYPPAAVSDPTIAATAPAGTSPFGQITTVPTYPAQTDPVYPTLSALHRIGDTKHHLVTYSATATSRFGKFFARTSTVTLGVTKLRAGHGQGVGEPLRPP